MIIINLPALRYQMCSFAEITVDKFTKNRCDYMNLTRFSNQQLARMYPKVGCRTTSQQSANSLFYSFLSEIRV